MHRFNLSGSNSRRLRRNAVCKSAVGEFGVDTSRLVTRFFIVEGNSAAERRGRAAEQRVLKLETELGEWLEHLEKSNSAVSEIEKKSRDAREDIDARISSLEKSASALRQLIERQAHQVSASGSPASNAGMVKSSGRLALDLRTEEITRDLNQSG